MWPAAVSRLIRLESRKITPLLPISLPPKRMFHLPQIIVKLISNNWSALCGWLASTWGEDTCTGIRNSTGRSTSSCTTPADLVLFLLLFLFCPSSNLSFFSVQLRIPNHQSHLFFIDPFSFYFVNRRSNCWSDRGCQRCKNPC